MTELTPTPNNDIRHVAAGNLSFLLSVIRCGEQLSEAETANVRDVINKLTGPASNEKRAEAIVDVLAGHGVIPHQTLEEGRFDIVQLVKQKLDESNEQN